MQWGRSSFGNVSAISQHSFDHILDDSVVNQQITPEKDVELTESYADDSFEADDEIKAVSTNENFDNYTNNLKPKVSNEIQGL